MPRVSAGGLRSVAHMHGAESIARTTTKSVGVANSVFRVFGVRREVQQIMRSRFKGWSIIAASKVKDGAVQFHIEFRTREA